MNQVTVHKKQQTIDGGDLYLAFELGNRNWKLALTVGFGQKPPERTIVAGDLTAVKAEIDAAKRRFGLPEDRFTLNFGSQGRQHPRLQTSENFGVI